ncbi:phospholipase A2 inhibitor and Ly6/PLAUR domain-containing protein-like [Emydura macquarii macquarii]|uniref:phospholipase A2 inhibitor and Ly6/PLAUR domain-containing protein-like n=1 Tax=Emydura macquarii macquarii TaxID=1129001 RepID=UPI00352B7C10
MTKGPIILCLLGTLQAMTGAQNHTGSPLTCFYCKSGRSCHPTPQTCSLPQDACIIVTEHNTLGAENSGTYQSCADSRRSLTGFLAFYFGDKVAVEIQSEICKSEDCNIESMTSRLAISTIHNGLQCPACYAPGSESCESDGRVLCTGGADQCAAVIGTLAQGDVTIPFAARGCATRAACGITTLESGVFTYKLTEAQCSPAPKAETSSAPRTPARGPFTLGSIVRQAPLFLPALLGLFLC